jgi:hypothetical protein
MYNEEIKKNCRTIHTNLYGNKNLEIIRSVEGQLSDGMWENSFAMRGYWLFFCVDSAPDGEVLIHIANDWGDMDFGKMRYNKFGDMKGQYEVLEWFAKKIKQIIKQEQKDAWENHPIEWKRDCEVVSKYLGYDEQITVKDCYEAYDILLGRK